MKRGFFFLLFFSNLVVSIAQVRYEQQDSVRIEQLLHTFVDENESIVLFYARQFLGVPYVAHTLEISGPEELVVNTREMDCTTFVETVLALAKTKREGRTTFADYCRYLESFRYFRGQRKGYLSRLHYFTWWIKDNCVRENVSEVKENHYSTASFIIKNCYMSSHPKHYRMLRLHPEWTDSIRQIEEKFNGVTGTYIPQRFVTQLRKETSSIADGDIVAVVTNRMGLDYSHLGFAVWGKDGLLHLLNASSIRKKVVEETLPLAQYLSQSPSRIGIRCFRLQ